MLTRLTMRLRRRRTLQLGSAVVLLLAVALASLVWLMRPRAERSWAVERMPRQLAVSADARTLVAVDERSVQLYDIATQQQRAAMPYRWDFAYRSGERNVVLSPDGRKVAVRNDGQEVPRIQLWRPDLAAEPLPLADSLDIVGFTADSRTLVVWGDGRYMLWDAVTGQQRSLPFGMGQSVVYFRPMADGRILALEARAAEGWFADEAWLVVWDVTAGKPMSILVGDLGPATMSPDGRLVAARGASGIHLFEANSGNHLARFPVGDAASDNPSLVFSPDGRRLLVEDREMQRASGQEEIHPFRFGSLIQLLQVWDVAALPPRKVGILGGDYVFSPEGRWLASSDDDVSTLPPPGVIVDADTLIRRAQWNDPLRLDAVFGPDDLTFATVGIDAQTTGPLLEWLLPKRTPPPPQWYVAFWGLPRCEQLFRITGASAVAYFPDGKSAAVGREDSTIEVWRVPPQRSWFVTLAFPLVLLLLIGASGWLALQFLRPLPAAPAGNPEPHSGQ